MMMKHDYRNFTCDKCGAVKKIQTNHEGQVYMQKCPSWPCTAGLGDYASFTFTGAKDFIEVHRGSFNKNGSKLMVTIIKENK